MSDIISKRAEKSGFIVEISNDIVDPVYTLTRKDDDHVYIKNSTLGISLYLDGYEDHMDPVSGVLMIASERKTMLYETQQHHEDEMHQLKEDIADTNKQIDTIEKLIINLNAMEDER